MMSSHRLPRLACVLFLLLVLLSACSSRFAAGSTLSQSSQSTGSNASAPQPPLNPPAIPTPVPTPSQSVSLACTHRLSGGWNFGTAPSACDVAPLQTTALILGQYPNVFYDDQSSIARVNYMSLMYPVVRDVGTYYLKRRNPSVSSAEIDGFLQGLYTLAAQESYWSHYRKGADGIMRYMRGDSDHGFGVMQVDDRSHASGLQQGRGVDLVENMIYGLDIFYSEWVSSASASCVSSPSNYQDRARAAWAAYNGGHGSICRWKYGGAYASNDAQFFAKFNARAWLGYTSNTRAASNLDIICLAEGTRPCAAHAIIATLFSPKE